jgi:hypothetical protein
MGGAMTLPLALACRRRGSAPSERRCCCSGRFLTWPGAREVHARSMPGTRQDAAGGLLPGNDRGAAVKKRAIYPISVSAGATCPAGATPPAWHEGRGNPGWKGGSGLMRWPDLTARAEPSMDAADPGRQASGTCPPVRYPAAAEAAGRSAPTATAREPRRPPGRPRLPGGTTPPGAPGSGAGRCLPRQGGRPVTRQAARQPRPAGAPAGPAGAGGAGQRRNIPAG